MKNNFVIFFVIFILGLVYLFYFSGTSTLALDLSTCKFKKSNSILGLTISETIEETVITRYLMAHKFKLEPELWVLVSKTSKGIDNESFYGKQFEHFSKLVNIVENMAIWMERQSVYDLDDQSGQKLVVQFMSYLKENDSTKVTDFVEILWKEDLKHKEEISAKAKNSPIPPY